MDNDFATGYALGADSGSKDVCVMPNNYGGGFGGGSWGEMIFAIIILAMFCGNGWGGFGGFGGGGNAFQGALTRADLCQDMNFNNLESGVRGLSQGICDSTFALNNTITSGFNANQLAMMQGFNGVDNAVCTLGYQQQAGFNALGTQLAQCCCDTRSAIGDLKYQMATDTCALQTSMANNTRDIIDSQNAGTRAILDYLCQEKISDLQAENQALRLAASQSNQNNVIGARIDAATAEILRRTGAECPTAAYIVQPPQPVSFATNCSGQAVFNNGYGYNGNSCGCNSGCGNGCC